MKRDPPWVRDIVGLKIRYSISQLVSTEKVNARNESEKRKACVNKFVRELRTMIGFHKGSTDRSSIGWPRVHAQVP